MPCRDVDFEDFTETEQSRFSIQRINKIGELQAIETVAANKFATKPTVSNAQAINQAFKFPIAPKQLFEFAPIFFVRTVVIILIQDPAHIINKLHLAMASCRVLMVLVRIYLYEHQHARVYYLHGGSRNSDSGCWPIGL
jgi:hypothetical protein